MGCQSIFELRFLKVKPKPNSKLIHARYRHYDGILPEGLSSIAYDPNNVGIEAIITLDEMIQSDKEECLGVSLEGVIAHHHKRCEGNDYHNVHLAATQEQWDAVKRYKSLIMY